MNSFIILFGHRLRFNQFNHRNFACLLTLMVSHSMTMMMMMMMWSIIVWWSFPLVLLGAMQTFSGLDTGGALLMRGIALITISYHSTGVTWALRKSLKNLRKFSAKLSVEYAKGEAWMRTMLHYPPKLSHTLGDIQASPPPMWSSLPPKG